MALNTIFRPLDNAYRYQAHCAKRVIWCRFLFFCKKTRTNPCFPGHISGIVQLFLFVFMVGVEGALLTQEWLLGAHPSQCQFKTDYLLQMSYPYFLLALQLFVAPFVVQSRRNYREGLLFCIGSFCLLIVTLSWSSIFALIPDIYGDHWHQISLCIGLLATPTVLLIVIFLPKVGSKP